MAKTTIDSLSYWSKIATVKAEVKKTKDLSEAFVKYPTETLKALGSDPIVATDKNKKEITLSGLLQSLDEAHRKPIVDSILVAAEKIEKARVDFEDVVAANIGKAKLKPLPDILITPVPKPVTPVPKPVIPVPKPVTPVPKPVTPVPKPVTPVPKPITPVPKPKIPIPRPITPVPDPLVPIPKPLNNPHASIKESIVNLKDNLAKMEAIQKSLPAKATKAEKKAAANAVQNAKALLSAAEKSAKSAKTKAIKKAKKKNK